MFLSPSFGIPPENLVFLFFMRVWHNIGCGLDAIEYIEGKMYGVVYYTKGKEKVLGNHKWLATMMTRQGIEEYIEWCDLVCDKLIYNIIVRRDDQDEWK
jgi:hypothetical protein